MNFEQDTVIEETSFATALRIKLKPLPNGNKQTQFLCIAPTHGSYIAWRNSLNLQVADCRMILFNFS